MKQEQVRPVRHPRATPQQQDHDADEIWPRAAREFLKPPGAVIKRKGFRYDSEQQDAGNE
jgi:hypothetical protein